MTDSHDSGASPSSTERSRPTYKRELLEEAKDADGPVTDVDWPKSGRRVNVNSIWAHDGDAYRVEITAHPEYESEPNVTFAHSSYDSDVGVLRDWSSLATGRLTGPQDLASWSALFTVFKHAQATFNLEVRDDAE